MAAYLIFLNILILGISGMAYMFSSDILDIVVPFGTGIGYSHPDTDLIQDILTFAFKYLPVWLVLGLVMFDYSMAQKPERPY